MGYPINSGLRGLARVTFVSEIEPWDFDLPMVPRGTDPVEVSDWHRRHPRTNNRDGNIDRAADAFASGLAERKHGRNRLAR